MLLHAYKARGISHEERLPREEFFAAFGGQTGPNPSSYPEMHGKAAHMRHLVPVLVDVCKDINEEHHLTAPEHVHRLMGLQRLLQFDTIVAQGDEVLPDDEAKRLLEIVNDFCLRQNFLDLSRACMRDRGVAGLSRPGLDAKHGLGRPRLTKATGVCVHIPMRCLKKCGSRSDTTEA